VFPRGSTGGEALYRQATQACNPVLGFPDELPSRDEFLLSGTGLVDLIYDIMYVFTWFCAKEN